MNYGTASHWTPNGHFRAAWIKIGRLIVGFGLNWLRADTPDICENCNLPILDETRVRTADDYLLHALCAKDL